MLPQPPNSVSTQISWVYTDELARAHEFYARMLGFKCTRDQGVARIYRSAPGACIGVCLVHADRVIEPRGGMISIVIDDVDACYRRLLKRGVAIDEAPRRDDDFGIYRFCVHDPNGYVIEFQQFLHA